MSTIQKILVTGGGGFLGKAIVKRLLTSGARVASLSRNRYTDLEAWGVQQFQGDIADPSVIQSAVSGCDTVFHTAAKCGIWGDYDDFYRTNVTGTMNIVDACRRQGVPQLIHTSSPSVVFNGKDMENVDESVSYPDVHHAHYPKTKAMAERYVRDAASEIATIVLRPHLIWGPGDNQLIPRILERARSRRLVRIGDGQNHVDTVYIDNAALAHTLAMEALSRDDSLSGNVYFISQGDPTPLWEMIDAILKAGGLPPVKRAISVPMARLLARIMELAYRLLPLRGEPPLTRFAAEELSTSHWFCIDAARKDLGYQPEVSIQEGLHNLARWLREKKTKEYSHEA